MPSYPDIVRSPAFRRTGAAVAVAAGSLAIGGTAESQPMPQQKNEIKTDALAQPIGHLASVHVLKVRNRTHKLIVPSEALNLSKRHRGVQHHAPKHLTPAQIAAKEVTPQEFAAWSKVNVCEEGGNWHVKGPTYSGGLGISNFNWGHYGGGFFAQNAGDATPQEQIVIAERIQPNPPDQNGCAGSW